MLARILQLQQENLGVERVAPALELVLLVELADALRVLHQRTTEAHTSARSR